MKAMGCGGVGEIVIAPESQSKSVSGREVRAHPHDNHSGHWSSLAGRGESGQCGLPLATVTVSPGLPGAHRAPQPPLCMMLFLG